MYFGVVRKHSMAYLDCPDHPWEKFYKEKGRGDHEPFPRFYEVLSFYKKSGCRHILDLGCGSGRHLIHLARSGFGVVGMDVSPTALRLTREWAEQEGCDASLVLADMRVPLPFKENNFEGVFSTQVIHHARLAVVRRTIGEIFRILKSGGIAFITVSARKDDLNHIEIEPNTYVPQTGPERGVPHHIFSENELRQSFQSFYILEISLRDEGKVLAMLAQK
jgi:SAM-dependent methyltransferase